MRFMYIEVNLLPKTLTSGASSLVRLDPKTMSWPSLKCFMKFGSSSGSCWQSASIKIMASAPLSKANSAPVRIAAPLPRLSLWRSSQTPVFPGKDSGVMEPSSTTTMLPAGMYFFVFSIVSRSRLSSLKEGITTNICTSVV